MRLRCRRLHALSRRCKHLTVCFSRAIWSNVSFRNGIKHNASASSQMRLGFVSITPSFQYNEFWAFQELNGRLIEDESGAVQQVTDTLTGFSNYPGLAAFCKCFHTFLWHFRIQSQQTHSGDSSRAQSHNGSQLYTRIAADSNRKPKR